MKKGKKKEGSTPPQREPLHVIRRKPAPLPPPLPPRVITPSQLKAGLEGGKRELQAITDELVQFFRTCPGVREVQVALAFNQEGKFLGIGTGAPITLKIQVKVEK